MTDRPQSDRTAGELLSDALGHLGRLVHAEVALARAEIEEKLGNAQGGVALLALALVLAVVSLNGLAAAAVFGLAALGLGFGWGALAVGSLAALLAAVLARQGMAALRPANLSPTRTARSVRRDADMLKEIVSNDPPH